MGQKDRKQTRLPPTLGREGRCIRERRTRLGVVSPVAAPGTQALIIVGGDATPVRRCIKYGRYTNAVTILQMELKYSALNPTGSPSTVVIPAVTN